MSKVLVIGAGAAGMMAAVAAAGNGHEVHVFEKNEKCGKKIYITGKGRCNLTNNCESAQLMNYVRRNQKFLYSAFHSFTNQDCIEFFEQAGCRTKAERGGRIFPVSDHASDVIAALTRRMKERGVAVHLNSQVTGILSEDIAGEGQCSRRVTGIRLADAEVIEAGRVIVATGGLAYPATGSTGDGYRFAREAGHLVTEQFPSLVPFEIAEPYIHRLQGLSLKNVELAVLQGKKLIYKERGELLFTHFGISGPLVLTASSYVGELIARKRQRKEKSGIRADAGQREELRTHDAVEKGNKERTFDGGRVKKWNVHDFADIKLEINLKPALTDEQLDQRIRRDFEESGNKQFKNSLGGMFPAKLIPVMIELSGIGGEKRVREITREERRHFISLIRHFPMTMVGFRSFQEAVITKGGVAVKQVNPSTMESKCCRGLYFAGEVLDVDAQTGGFNLQIAWSSGYLAGISV